MKQLIFIAVLCYGALSAGAQNVTYKVKVDGYTVPDIANTQIRVYRNSKIVIVATYNNGAAKDSLEKIELNACGGGNKPQSIYTMQSGVQRGMSGKLSLKRNIVTYTFDPLTLSGCRDESFWIFFTSKGREGTQKLDFLVLDTDVPKYKRQPYQDQQQQQQRQR